jgi:hypothetical protein
MNRVHALLRLLGTTGVLGLGVLFFCIPFYLSAVLPAERELAAQRDAMERLRSRGPFRPVTAGSRADDLQRFYRLFPPSDRLTDQLEAVYSLAREAQLELMQGEYRLDKRDGGLLAYRITLPIHGTYAQVRAFVGSVLKEMPIASVDALRFERKKAAETQIDAQVQLTIHFRVADEAR